MTTLNPAQERAVTTLEGLVLSIAGAGSGKTRVIEERTLRIQQQGTSPESVLLLTLPFIQHESVPLTTFA